MLRDLLRAVPELDGHRIVGEAAGPTAAVAGIQRLAPDLVLLDLNLGARSGPQVLAELRRRGVDRPALVVSMSEQPREMAQAMDLGAAGFVREGSSREELREAIRTVPAGGRHLAQAETSAERRGRRVRGAGADMASLGPDNFIDTRHDPLLVGAALLVAAFASYVTLDLARRVHSAGPGARWTWWAGGSAAMGTGVWAMHFVGMLGFDAGMLLGYRWGPTLLSWVAAVGAAAVALGIATRERLGPAALLGASTGMALAICTMHYLGMSALELVPGIVWRQPVVLLSVAIAWGASAAALAILFALRRHRGLRRLQRQVAASIVMGGALLLSVIDAMGSAREAQLARSLQRANVDLREANDALMRRAFEDTLTGLPNRALFNDRLQHAVARIERGTRTGVPPGGGAERLAVLFLDLDGFKPINDSFGHAAGDEVLREVGRRLLLTVRDSDTLARLGRDEFVAMIESRDAAAAAVSLAQRLIDSLRRPFPIAGQEVSLSCSIGVAVYPDHDDGRQRLLACADAAMYAAKRAAGGTCVVYEPGMGGDVAEQVLLQQHLRLAIERGELML